MDTKDIMLKIVGKQIYADAEEDQVEFVTEGKLSKEGDALFLTYEESEISGIPGCKTVLTLEQNRIRMKRNNSGEITDGATLDFQKGKRYSALYDTPYGAVEVEVLTNDIQNNITVEGKGTVDIDYNISLKGLAEGRNKLNIQIM